MKIRAIFGKPGMVLFATLVFLGCMVLSASLAAMETDDSGVAPSDARRQAELFATVTSLDKRAKRKFLSDMLISLQKEGMASKYMQDANALYSVLAKLSLDDDVAVAEGAAFHIYLFAMASPSNYPQSIYVSLDIGKSAEIQGALEELIFGVDTSDEVRGRAIDAHSLLYPPQDTIIDEFDRLLSKAGDREDDTLTAIFDAYSRYKRKYDYETPTSMIEAARKLVNHRSESVKTKALYVLRKEVGKPLLPLLFQELEKTRSAAVSNRIVIDILTLDQSDETVRKLKAIAVKSKNSQNVTYIERYTSPEHIEHFKSLAVESREE